MRAHEFVTEARSKSITKNGRKLPPDIAAVMPSAYRMGGSNDKLYELLYLMRVAASTDGVTVPQIDDNWIGLNDTAHPYTKEEAAKLKKAFGVVGIEWQDALSPNLDNKSVEPSGVNSKSPINAFGGYIKKRKK